MWGLFVWGMLLHLGIMKTVSVEAVWMQCVCGESRLSRRYIVCGGHCTVRYIIMISVILGLMRRNFKSEGCFEARGTLHKDMFLLHIFKYCCVNRCSCTLTTTTLQVEVTVPTGFLGSYRYSHEGVGLTTTPPPYTGICIFITDISTTITTIGLHQHQGHNHTPPPPLHITATITTTHHYSHHLLITTTITTKHY